MNWADFENVLKRAMQPIKDKVLLMIGRAVLAAVKEGGPFQQVQISLLAGESMDKVTRFGEFGFASNPPTGTEGIVLALQGNRENLVVIATEHRTLRFKNCASGESAIYTDDGTFIHLKKAGQVQVTAATKVTVTCPNAEFSGDVKILGKLEVVGATKLNDTLTVFKAAEFKDEVIMLKNLAVTMVVGAAGYTGPSGGAVAISVPLNSTQPISTTGDVTGANVIGGGTDLASVKSTFNAHTHSETGTTTSGPSGTL